MKGKDIAIIYGGEWIGKAIDKGVTMVAPLQANVVKISLAVVLPLLSVFLGKREYSTVRDVSLLAGAFLATKV